MRILPVILSLVLLSLLAGCGEPLRGPGSDKPYTKVSYNASDNTILVARYYPSEADKGLVMIHMAAKSKSSYEDYAARLQEDYKVIVPDLRGHGDSQGEYTGLSNHDFRDMTLDIGASAKFLVTEGVDRANISIVGASVGANLALVYAKDHPVDRLILLSPTTRSRGIDISNTRYDEPLLIQVGHYDGFSSISVDEIEINLQKATVKEYDSSAHGTDLLNYHKQALEDFYSYLR